MRVATGEGDSGKTRFGGREYFKDDLLIEALGQVDELVSSLGLVYLYEPHWDMRAEIREIQDWLLTCAHWLCMAAAGEDADSAAISSFLEELTRRCRRLEGELHLEPRPVLPGNNMSSTYLDHARVVARRCERRMVSLKRQGEVDPDVVLKLTNRLSDYLWLLARRAELQAS
ncbi:MAG TPA: ATP:cob(I)alamin adenosyltransferase [Kiritimatiellae bacterium]|nr:ATP:cob(I)alamin adenosyltransferase [Kiritimatiellia bacterium]